MNLIEIILAIAMFFAGGVGTLVIMYISRIANGMDKMVILVTDIDKRVVRLETKCAT